MKDFDEAANRKAYEAASMSPEAKARIESIEKSIEADSQRVQAEQLQREPERSNEAIKKALQEHHNKDFSPPGTVRESDATVTHRVKEQIRQQDEAERNQAVAEKAAQADAIRQAEATRFQLERQEMQRLSEQKQHDREVTQLDNQKDTGGPDEHGR